MDKLDKLDELYDKEARLTLAWLDASIQNVNNKTEEELIKITAKYNRLRDDLSAVRIQIMVDRESM